MPTLSENTTLLADLEKLKETVEEWKAKEIEAISKRVAFLKSLQGIAVEALTEETSAEAVTEATTTVNSLLDYSL